MLKRTLLGALAASALALPASAQDLCDRFDRRADRPAVQHLCPRRSMPCASISTGSTKAAASTASKIKLILEDDGAQPSKAAANTKS